MAGGWAFIARMSLGAALLAAPAVAAAADRAPVRVRVVAPEGCATDASFSAALVRKTDRVRLAETTEPATSINVTIRSDGARFRGDLQVVHDADKRTTTRRRAQGATCGEITDGLAMLAARAFEPAPEGERDEDAPRTRAPAPPPPPAPPGAPEAPLADVERAAEAHTPTLDDADLDDGPTNTWRIAFGASGGLYGFGAGTPFAYGGFADVALDRSSGGFTFAPRIRVGGAHGEAEDRAWTFATGSFCPFRADLSRAVSLLPCVAFDGGTARDTVRGQRSSTAKWWVMARGGADLVWRASKILFFETGLSFGVPVVRPTLDATNSWDPPVIVPVWNVAMGLRLP